MKNRYETRITWIQHPDTLRNCPEMVLSVNGRDYMSASLVSDFDNQDLVAASLYLERGADERLANFPDEARR